jgi:hypothetical protein
VVWGCQYEAKEGVGGASTGSCQARVDAPDFGPSISNNHDDTGTLLLLLFRILLSGGRWWASRRTGVVGVYLAGVSGVGARVVAVQGLAVVRSVVCIFD